MTDPEGIPEQLLPATKAQTRPRRHFLIRRFGAYAREVSDRSVLQRQSRRRCGGCLNSLPALHRFPSRAGGGIIMTVPMTKGRSKLLKARLDKLPVVTLAIIAVNVLVFALVCRDPKYIFRHLRAKAVSFPGGQALHLQLFARRRRAPLVEHGPALHIRARGREGSRQAGVCDVLHRRVLRGFGGARDNSGRGPARLITRRRL